MTPVDSNGLKKNLYFLSGPVNEVKSYEKSETSRRTKCVDLPSEITKVFKPYIRILRWAGVCSSKVAEVDGTLYVSHKVCSLRTVYVCFTGAVQLLFATFLILNTKFGIKGEFHRLKASNGTGEFPSGGESSLETSELKQVFQLVFPISGTLYILAGRIRVTELEKFLNNWTIFILKFHDTFGPFHTFQLTFLKNYRKSISIVTSVMVISLVLSRFGSRALLPIQNELLNSVLTNMMIGYTIAVTSVYAVVTLIGLQTVRLGFRETRIAMHKQYVGAKRLTREDVKSWTQLVMDIRKQVSIFQDFATIPELVDLLTNFVTMLSLSYFAITSVGTENGLLSYGISAVFIGLFRTAIRGVFAEGLMKEEEMLAFSVLDMKPATNDCETLLEMKILCDTIFSNPTKFTLGNIITVNKRLVLSIISQLAANLVVFLQFRGNEK